MKFICGRGIFRIFGAICAGLTLAVTLTGCKPPGPRALLDGKRLIERGQYAQAVDRLKTATTLLSTNAQAWNYLGLAYHLSGQANDAADAYKKALALDQNLVEVHYNLGCLWLEQDHPDLAKGELTTYTMHREKSPEGFVKLGAADLALKDLTGAERSFNQARQIDPQNPEALNDMGLVEMQRNKMVEAAQFFNAALRAKADYAPGMLNLAIVSERLGNRQYALQRYQDYLTLKPRPANWDEVDAVVRDLQEGGNGSTTAARPTPPPVANTVTQTPPSRATTRPTRSESSAPTAARATTPRETAMETPPTEVVQVTPEPVIRGAPETGSASEPVVTSNATHRGLLSRMFGKNSKPSQPTRSPEIAPVAQPMPEPPPPVYPRYSYRSPRKPAEGDRPAAQKAVVEGVQAQQAKEWSTAVADYRRGTQLDPAYFDAYYNLGLASYQMGNLPQALTAYETALAIEPESHDARFNFALALKAANYPADAANELEKVVARSPNDVYAHYALGNIYSQQLRQTAKAREHYQKVLELKPSFPQASVIRTWLYANP